MPRKSQREIVRQKVRDYLAIAEASSPDDHPLNVRSVAARLEVSPTTLNKHQLSGEIHAAEKRQRKNAKLSGKLIERRTFADHLVICPGNWRRRKRRTKSWWRRSPSLKRMQPGWGSILKSYTGPLPNRSGRHLAQDLQPAEARAPGERNRAAEIRLVLDRAVE